MKTDPSTESFLIQTYKKWGWIKSDDNIPQFTPIIIDPIELWSRDPYDLLNDVAPEKFGEYMIAESNYLDPTSAIPVILDEQPLDGKIFGFVAYEVSQKHSDSHHLAGIDYWKWLCENPDLIPDSFKMDNTEFYFFGSLIRDRDGYWMIPCYTYNDWDDRKENREDYTFLTQIWFKICRAVILEK
ncbi:hypothetical protein L9Z41_18090 [Leptospira noguchii]|uniref:hypothetical protein n=1 Tax=Leptospira noguchii TaxID=28182 RepID=UPI001F066AC1|nr:hypothetical protein [Leptospira noguchii]MCH1911991.1 hypothetical protein [Leptospira noguchii]MCH1917482.1 hypothetical protein [Leptospira noguchii]UOG63125.1 hypothetical protein MAL04_12220 [Leptospira noguchii]